MDVKTGEALTPRRSDGEARDAEHEVKRLHEELKKLHGYTYSIQKVS